MDPTHARGILTLGRGLTTDQVEAVEVVLAELDRLDAVESRATAYTKLRGPVLPDREAVARWILHGDG